MTTALLDEVETPDWSVVTFGQDHGRAIGHGETPDRPQDASE